MVPRECLTTLSSVLLKNGYEADQNLNDPDILKSHINNIEIHHLCAFKKCILNGTFEIHLEIHHVIDVNWHTFFLKNHYDLTHFMLENTAFNKVKNCNIRTLCIEDRLIVSMHHFARHLVSNITGFAVNDCGQLFQCKTLLDAFLLYQKYQNQLNYEILYNKIELYGFKDYIAISNKFIEELFDERIFNCEMINNLNDYKYNVWQNIISDAIIKTISSEFLLTEDSEVFYKAVIDRCISRNPNYYCKKGYRDNQIILIDEFAESETKRRFGTISREGLNPKSPNDSKAEIKMTWDNEYLYIIFNVTDKCLKYYGKTQKNIWSDGVTLSIYNPDFTLSKNNLLISLMFNIAIAENEKKYVLVSNNIQTQNKEFSENKILNHICEFEEAPAGYNLYLKLNWVNLDVNIKNIDHLGMDIAINNVNSDDAVIDSVLCWSNPVKSYYCPAKFGKIILIP